MSESSAVALKQGDGDSPPVNICSLCGHFDDEDPCEFCRDAFQLEELANSPAPSPPEALPAAPAAVQLPLLVYVPYRDGL